MLEETTVTCPRCGSSLVIQVANQKHCNACGAEFDLVRDPVGQRAQKARAEAVGWPRNTARTA